MFWKLMMYNKNSEYYVIFKKRQHAMDFINKLNTTYDALELFVNENLNYAEYTDMEVRKKLDKQRS